MRIQRCSSIYKIDFFSLIKIRTYQLLLLLKRLKRRMVILKRYLKNVLPSMLLILIYLIIICNVGSKLGNYNLFDCLWDSKELVFTTLVLSVIIPYYDYMKERHQRLDKQLSDYFYTYGICTYIMNCFDRLIGINEYKNMLWDNDKNDEYYDDVLSLHEIGVIDYDDRIIQELKDYEDYLEEALEQISKSIKSNRYIGCENITYDYEKFLINICERYRKTVKRIKKQSRKADLILDMKKINYDFHQLLADIRRPWRWDRKIDKKIDFIILKNGKCITDYDIVRYRSVYK